MKKINIPLISAARSCGRKLRRKIAGLRGKKAEESQSSQLSEEEAQESQSSQLSEEETQESDQLTEESQTSDQPAKAERIPEQQFTEVWIRVFREKAKVFNGLYSSILRLSKGNMKRKIKILREWCQRTHYQWEGQEPDRTAAQFLAPLIENESEQECIRWMELLLLAMKKAGIRWDKAEQEIVLDDHSVLAYMDWNGEELYPGDMVRIITPAWYQGDKVIEQGKVNLIKTEEETDDR